MQRLSIRQDFALHEQSLEQRKNTEQRDRVREAGAAAVAQMFPQGQASLGVQSQLVDAVARLERCREQDTDDRGIERPTPMTRSTLDLGVHESVQGLPQRRGGFDISPEGRTDADGNLLHEWDPVNGGWIPTKHAHGR